MDYFTLYLYVLELQSSGPYCLS